jgi:hypothetical protein
MLVEKYAILFGVAEHEGKFENLSYFAT